MHAKRGKLFSIVIVLSLATLSTTTGRARTATVALGTQETTARQQITSDSKVEPLADGTKNPALITDEVALRVLFLTTDVPANATASDAIRLRAKVGRMHLDESDMTVLIQHLGRLHHLVRPQRTRIAAAREAGMRKPTTTAFATLAALDGQLDTMAADTYRELQASLSPEGTAKLRAHVAYVKTKIKVLPPPKMPPSHH